MRNRLGATEARNKRDVGATLEVLAKRIGFRTVKGFGESGDLPRALPARADALMDVREAGVGIQMVMSHVAARLEVRAPIGAIRKPLPRLALTPPAA
jgi:chromosome partitioning protein